jgi:3'(2'), 5'-bisphosphate nucleotidase
MRDRLRQLLESTGTEILAIRDGRSRLKADGSPVTLADQLSHDRIVADLARWSDVLVVSEEADQLPDTLLEEFWLLDPLDGTKEFVKESGEFTINLALIRNARPILGIVHLPVTRTTYWGDETGAYIARADEAFTPIRASSADGDDLRSRPTRVAVSRDHITEGDEAIIARLGDVEWIPAGSALKLCLVAEGSADVYVRAGNTMEWDTAAAHAILLAAGGQLRTLDGSELTYGKPRFLNPGFVAATTPTLLTRAVTLPFTENREPGTEN